MSRLRHVLPAFVALGGALLLSACSGSPARYPVNLDVPAVIPTSVPDNPPPHGFDVESGAQIYMIKCVGCHGTFGRGDGPQAGGIRAQGKQVADLVAKAPTADPATWYRLVGAGNIANLMPGFSGSLNQQERWDVTQYALSLARTRIDSGDGTLVYSLANRTPGGSAPAGLTVTLHAYVGNGQAFTRTAVTDGQGVAVFHGLAARESIFYQAETLYGGGRFFSEPQQITSTNKSAAVGLPVFETTSDPGVLSISAYQFVVEGVTEGAISVIEAYAFQNTSERAFVAADSRNDAPRSISVAYPTGAENLQFDGAGLGDRFLRDGALLRDMDAVLPGAQASVVMLYDLPYRGGTRIERRMTAPVKRWEVIVPDSDLRAAGLQDLGAEAIPGAGITMRRFAPAGTTLAAGQSVQFNLEGQPRAARITALATDPRLIGVGFILFAIALAVAYVLLARARWGSAAAPTRESLLAELAALDDAHAAGKVVGKRYASRREALLRALRQVWVT
ncbi:MAG: cytochrome c [Thermoflexales bacterium]|nr:cytochrome c [Thermoflexales bacterium]